MNLSNRARGVFEWNKMGSKRGFTVIELIMVIVVITLVAFVASPLVENLPNTRAYYAVHKMRSDLRYAQELAIVSQARTRVVFDASIDRYQIERETSPNLWVAATDPATKGNYQVDFNTGDYQGVDITVANLNGTTTVIFDSYGAPFDGNGVALPEPAYVDLNSKYRLNFRSQTGKADLTIL